ncbi:MAG: FlgD immunoglobulin-like domain containing protein [Candidatus Krumholzibacteriia bacterium]
MASTGSPGEYNGFIPGQPGNTTVSYYITAADSAGRSAASPADAPATVHQFLVGTRQTVFLDTLEDGAPGWTHGGTNDDWELGPPQGLAEDPASAFSGANVWGNDLSGLGPNSGKYENYSDTWLESPAVSCSAYTSVVLSFQRWLSVEKSNNGQWDWARVSVNGTTVWESPSSTHLIDTQWTYQEIDISSLADNNETVKVRFELHSDVSFTFGGWNLDDVRITGIGPSTSTSVAQTVLPARVVLHPNIPNPYNPSTTLRFDLPARGFVDLSIYDVSGRLVRTLVRTTLDPGSHEVVWDGRGNGGEPSASGVYLYRLVTAGDAHARKMVLLR